MRRSVLFATVAAALLAPPIARADQAHVDPGSPSGKEYAVPLDQARRHAATGNTAAAPTGAAPAAPPLFGVGIRSSGSGAGTRANHRPRRTPPARSPKKPSAGISSAGATPTPHRLAAAAAQPSTGLGSTALVGALAAAVLVLGGVGGVALRRRAGP
jgi:hypothetical protein